MRTTGRTIFATLRCRPGTRGSSQCRTVGARGRRGFTFVELCMALVVCSMVFAAVLAFAMAMGRSWQITDSTQAGSLRASQIALRLQAELRGCDAVLNFHPGSLTNSGGDSASIFLWKNDADDAVSHVPDGQIQYSECTLIEFEPATSTTP